MPDDFDESLERIAKIAFETGAITMQTAITKWLRERGQLDLAQEVVHLPVPALPPVERRAA